MKNVAFAFMTMFLTVSAFAQIIGKSSPATKAEKLLLCHSIEKQLAAEGADMAVDLKKCTKAKITSTLVTEGILEVKGRVPFNSPERSFNLLCSVSYDAGRSDGDNLITEASCH